MRLDAFPYAVYVQFSVDGIREHSVFEFSKQTKNRKEFFRVFLVVHVLESGKYFQHVRVSDRFNGIREIHFRSWDIQIFRVRTDLFAMYEKRIRLEKRTVVYVRVEQKGRMIRVFEPFSFSNVAELRFGSPKQMGIGSEDTCPYEPGTIPSFVEKTVIL